MQRSLWLDLIKTRIERVDFVVVLRTEHVPTPDVVEVAALVTTLNKPIVLRSPRSRSAGERGRDGRARSRPRLPSPWPAPPVGARVDREARSQGSFVGSGRHCDAVTRAVTRLAT